MKCGDGNLASLESNENCVNWQFTRDSCKIVLNSKKLVANVGFLFIINHLFLEEIEEFFVM